LHPNIFCKREIIKSLTKRRVRCQNIFIRQNSSFFLRNISFRWVFQIRWYRWIATHSTWMFLNRGLCVRAGDSGAPGGTKGASLVALSRVRWQFVCFCAGTKRTRQPRYLMSEKLFLADYYQVVFAQREYQLRLW